jgi:threonine dehydratase
MPTTTDLSLENIERAASLIDPVFRDSPQFVDEELGQALGRRVMVKIETANPIRSFKGRGTDFLIRALNPKQKAVCASAGNFGQALAYAARSRGMAAEVFVAADANPAKVARIRAFGAAVTLGGHDFDAAKEGARAYAARHAECVFIEDGAEPSITEGAGTIGLELLKAGPLDAIIVPVGDGALITGIALWVKHHSPQTRIVGVCASGSPAMLHSWRAKRPVPTETADTIADGIATRIPVPKAVERMQGLVDDMVLVDDSQLIAAMKLAASTLGLILEPSGAAGLAAIQAHSLAGEQLATVLTGGNIHPSLIASLFS